MSHSATAYKISMNKMNNSKVLQYIILPAFNNAVLNTWSVKFLNVPCVYYTLHIYIMLHYIKYL
jgi:hypothetical protein